MGPLHPLASSTSLLGRFWVRAGLGRCRGERWPGAEGPRGGLGLVDFAFGVGRFRACMGLRV